MENLNNYKLIKIIIVIHKLNIPVYLQLFKEHFQFKSYHLKIHKQ